MKNWKISTSRSTEWNRRRIASPVSARPASSSTGARGRRAAPQRAWRGPWGQGVPICEAVGQQFRNCLCRAGPCGPPFTGIYVSHRVGHTIADAHVIVHRALKHPCEVIQNEGRCSRKDFGQNDPHSPLRPQQRQNTEGGLLRVIEGVGQRVADHHVHGVGVSQRGVRFLGFLVPLDV